MSYQTLIFEIADGVATLTLNRPEMANAMNAQMMVELNEIAIICDENTELRALLLTSSGGIFCGGGDLPSFAAEGDQLPAKIKQWAGYLHLAISRLSRMQAPVIAAVSGTAGGAGLSLVAAADLVIAGRSAKFVMAYTGAGLSPDGSSTYFLPRRIGDRRARELMLTNRKLSAEEALDWGLINQIVDDEEVLAAGQKLARSLAAGPTLAFGAVKSLLDSSSHNGLETQMEMEARSIAALASSNDAQEGIQAFLNKRKPQFTGLY